MKNLFKSLTVLAVASTAVISTAQAQDITIWSWDIAAKALEELVPAFNKQYPDIKVNVRDLGNNQVFDKSLAGCAAGGAGLPDVVTVENFEAEIFWQRFPNCFADLNTLGYSDEMKSQYPQFKRTELEMGGKAYAMPWDSGPVIMFYRRDFYEKAGINPQSITTWDDFIAAGKKIAEANPGVSMAQADFNGDSEFFRMIGNEQGCNYFSLDGQQITINQPSCVATLEKVKQMKDEGTLTPGDWNAKIQAAKGNKVASILYGAWFEGTLRTNAPETSGKWGVYRMPSLTANGPRAANLGGSSLAITQRSKQKDAAFKFVHYALGTEKSQIAMLKGYGLVPSLLSAENDPFVQTPQPFWGDQKIWVDILSTLSQIQPSRGTAFQSDAGSIFKATQTKYFDGGYDNAKTALDDAAKQIAAATGLPIAN